MVCDAAARYALCLNGYPLQSDNYCLQKSNRYGKGLNGYSLRTLLMKYDIAMIPLYRVKSGFFE